MKTVLIKAPTAHLLVRVYNPGQPHTLVLLHGGPGVPDYLGEVALLMTATPFTVLTFDQRGTGDSSALNHSYALDEYVRDVEAIVAHFGLTRFHLFGHSWGGVLAQLYARHHFGQLESLFLCNAAPGLGKYWRQMVWAETRLILSKARLPVWWQLGGSLLRSLGGEEPANRAWQTFFGITWQHYFSDPRKAPLPDAEWSKGIRAEAVTGTVRHILRADAALLDDMQLPTTLPVAALFGSYDFIPRKESPTLKRFPQAQVLILPKSGHVPWLQEREEFKAALHQFYYQVIGASPPA